jgi:hypothetical protein
MLPDGSIPLTKIMLEKMSLDCSANYRNIIDAFRDNFCVDAEGSQVELTDLTAVIHKFIGSKFLNQGLKEEVIKSFIMKYKIDDLVISGVKTKIISGIRMVKKARFMAFSEWISLVSRGIDVRID